MKRIRNIQLYYRDENKVMRKIEGLKLIVWRGIPDEVIYFEPDNNDSIDDKQRIRLKNDNRKW
jgi:hypothetical protein